MSEHAFLTCTPERRTFPSYGKQTGRKSVIVLSAPSYIPLLWWAMFRLEDLVLDRSARRAAEDGEAFPAPIVEHSRVAARLAEAIPRVKRLFPLGGSLSRHTSLLLAALEPAAKKHKFVTLEHLEIATDLPGFAKAQQGMLSCMAGKKVADLKSLLRLFTNVAGRRRFVLPDEVAKERFSQADKQDLYGLLGAGADKLAPWDQLKPLPPSLNSPQRIQAALSDACWNNDLAQARAMLALRASPNRRNQYGCSPLAYAVTRGSLELIELLLAAGAKPQADSVCEAARSGSREALQLLLDAGGDANSISEVDPSGKQYAVSLAADPYSDPREGKLKLLLERGANVNACNPQGDTCLAAAFENRNALRLMLPYSTKATRANAMARLQERIEACAKVKFGKFARHLQNNLQMVQTFRGPLRGGKTRSRRI